MARAKLKTRWKTLQSKTVHQNPWYRIRRDQVLRPDNRKGLYFVLDTPGPSVFVTAINSEKEVCLIKIHRYPVKAVSWEIPGGNSDGQNLLRAAKRELFEETGLRAKTWEKAGKWMPMNGVCSETAHIFIASGLYPAEKYTASAEGIFENRFVPFRRALEMVFSGKITDGQTIAGLLLAGRKLGYLGFKK